MPLFKQTKLNLPKTLSDRYIVPPFSVFNTHQTYWRERMRMWRDMGLCNRDGRDTHLCYDNRRMDKYAQKQSNGTSIFSPVLCEVIYKWFTLPNSDIFDPFAGGIVRGGVAAMLGHQYLGVDISDKQVETNQTRMNDLEQLYHIKGKAIWYLGNSCDDADMCDFIDMNNKCYDLVFTCPPYYNLETYTSNEHDLSNCKSYHDFIEKYRRALVYSYNVLKENSFFVIVVSDIRDKNTGEYYGFVADTIKECQNIGLKFYNEIILYNDTGNLAITSGNYLDKTRKVGRQHQNILVFYKGETKNIKEKFGSLN